MSTPGSFSDSVKQQADIVRLIGEYVKLKKAGAQNFAVGHTLQRLARVRHLHIKFREQ